MDTEFLELLNPFIDESSAEYTDVEVGISFTDPLAGEVEIDTPNGTMRYTLKPLGDLFGDGVDARTLDVNDERYMPLLMAIEESIVRVYEEDPRLTDARVSLALSDLAMNLESPPGPEPLRQWLRADLRLLLSLNDYSRRDVRRALRKIEKSVRRHTRVDGPQGYLNFILDQFR
ncbi:MAG: hypothetical protein R6X20_01015 [Phycisphaerae bacterium]